MSPQATLEQSAIPPRNLRLTVKRPSSKQFHLCSPSVFLQEGTVHYPMGRKGHKNERPVEPGDAVRHCRRGHHPRPQGFHLNPT